MRTAVLFFILGIIICTKAQTDLSSLQGAIRPLMGFPPSSFFLHFILQSEVQKLQLANPSLPEDLQKRVENMMNSAASAFQDCDNMATVLAWMQIRCITLQLQKSKNQLKVVEDEAKARVDASTVASI